MNKLKALIYKVQPYGESDRLLQAYTPKGKISLLAKGAQKLNNDLRILAQYLTELSFEYYEFKTFMPIRNAKLINDFNNIKINYNDTKEASLILELISKTIIDSKYSEKIYSLVIESLQYKNIQISTLSFAMKLTYYLGYGLNLKADGRKVIGLSINKGGVVYDDEAYPLDLNYDETLLLLKLTYNKTFELEELTNEQLVILKRFIFNYYNRIIDITLNTLQNVKEEGF